MTLLIIFLGFLACGGSEDRSVNANGEESGSILETLINSPEKLTELAEGATPQPVDFRVLEEKLPASILGFEMVDINGRTSGALGMNVSSVEAQYAKGESRIRISIFDAGGLGAATATIASWTKIRIDSEDKNGYNRTTKLWGFPAFERYESSGPESELSLFLHDRIVFTASGQQVEMDQLKQVVKKIGLAKFKDL